MNFKNTIIFTDGACSGNPGPGGWGAVIVTPAGQVFELGDGERSTTNNKMELMATIISLKSVEADEDDVDLYTDSTYVIRGITQWIFGWKKRGWKNAEGAPVKNRDLWEQLSEVVTSISQDRKINWHYVRGHTGIPGNERVDEIAVEYTKGKRPHLYEGSLMGYDIAIHDIPEDTSLPAQKSSSSKKAKAFSYVSLVDGVPKRHKTWPECEQRVKGRSGAKFKKAKSQEDERGIFASWGVDPP